MTQHCDSNRSRSGLRRLSLRLLWVVLLLSVALSAAACASSGGQAGSAESREAALRQIAAEYAANGDLQQAQARLDKLNLANPGQLLVSLAESDMAAGRAREEIEASARLAEMLGARSQKLIAYLSPTVALAPTAAVEPTVLAATVEPPATETAPAPTDAPASTSVPPTATEAPAATVAPPTSSPTPEPQNPRVMADSAVNLRGGPGKAYPVVGRLGAGQEVPIIGRNESGNWWQIEYDGSQQAWVAGTVIRVLGAIDTVAVAQNIPPVPTAAPRPTAAPQPTAPPAAQAPAPQTGGKPFVLQSLRLRSVGEGAQKCGGGGDHNIFITVVDANGTPLDGVRIYDIWSKEYRVSGQKGPGRAEYDLFAGGGGQLQIVDEANNPLSELTRGMSNTFPDFDFMKAAGYCDCKPHPDDASCESDIVNQQYLFAYGHYAYEVVFRRTY